MNKINDDYGFKLPEDFDEEVPFDLHFNPDKRIKLEISLQNSDGYFNIGWFQTLFLWILKSLDIEISIK